MGRMALDFTWDLRRVMADRGLWATTDLIPLLEERGVEISATQVYRLVTSRPRRLNTKALAAICDALDCSPNDLIKIQVPDDASGARVGVVAPLSDGEKMARPFPSEQGEIRALIGPVYSTRALTTLWGVTRSAIGYRTRNGQLLALQVKGRNLFPLFQFGHGYEVRADVIEVVNVLREAADPLTIARWLRTPHDEDLEGRSPLEILDAGGTDEVMQAARLEASRP